MPYYKIIPSVSFFLDGVAYKDVNFVTYKIDDVKLNYYGITHNITGFLTDNKRLYSIYSTEEEPTISRIAVSSNDYNGWKLLTDLPYYFENGSTLFYDGKVHILGGSDKSTSHYCLTNGEWISCSILPFNFYNGSAIVYNKEIHLLGGSGDSTSHYKWNGSTWVNASILPYDFINGSAVVLDNEIHIMGGEYSSTLHYKWDGETWISVSTLPYDFINGCAEVKSKGLGIPDNKKEIHIMGTSMEGSNKDSHYKWDGETWIYASTLPYEFSNGFSAMTNETIHILGGNTGEFKNSHYLIQENLLRKVVKEQP